MDRPGVVFSHRVSVTMSLVSLVRRDPLPKAAAGGLITLPWAPVALLGIWQSLHVHSSKSGQYQAPSFGPPAPLWWVSSTLILAASHLPWGCMGLLTPFHTTQMLKEIKDPTCLTLPQDHAYIVTVWLLPT